MKRVLTGALTGATAPLGPNSGDDASSSQKTSLPTKRADAALVRLTDRNPASAPRPAGPLGSRLAPLPPRTMQPAPTPTPAAAGWNPISRLKAEELADIPETVTETLANDIRELRNEVKDKGLDYVPVFGYLSLRYKNSHELGKNNQDEVREGKDWLPATLPGHDLDYVMSTQYRGHCQHPGVVAGLSRSEGKSMEGIILKLPVANAEELLARVIRRELLDENDLIHPSARRGQPPAVGQSIPTATGQAAPTSPSKPRSNLMYTTAVRPVTLPDGVTTVKALVFVTNPDSAKSLATVFKDSGGVSAEQLAYFMTSKGNLGGSSIDYWKRFVAICEQAGTPVPPMVRQAIALAEHCDPANADDVLRKLKGAATPRRVWHERKPEPQAGRDGGQTGAPPGSRPKSN
ncbi:type III effector protein [Ralstonia solanacearum]|uniref:type III effector protein n=1 Tax=Ralstonia solanacearum TaxID=305 RepID=UPI0035126E6A